MSVTSGLISLPASIEDEKNSPIMGKRKRPQEMEEQNSTSTSADIVNEERKRKNRFDEFLVDLLQVLRTYDTTPPILEEPIISVLTEGRSTKRVKLSTSSPITSITSLVQSHAYYDIEELITDVDSAISALNSTKRATELSHADIQQASDSSDKQPQAYQFHAFKKALENIIRREIAQNPELVIQPSREVDPLEGEDYVDEDKKPWPFLNIDGSGKTVLTLYGSAPTPKQLFSSIPGPGSPNLSKASQTLEDDVSTDQGAFHVENNLFTPSLRETALPNGIYTTKIIPVHSEESKDSKGQPLTFGDVFAPPSTVPPMNPPKQSRHTVTRSQSVNWFTPGEVSAPIRSRGRESYTTQSLSTGHWLTYNVAPSPAQLSSPGEKRKQRDRALSAGESKASLPEGTVIAHQQAKEEALFKSAYSSFAPDHDDTAALVSQQLKNRLWWKRVGMNRYHRLMSQYNVEDSSSEMEMADLSDDVEEDRLFEEAVDTWEPEEAPSDFDPTKKTFSDEKPGEKDVEEIMKEVSELLETLSSYQRVRNLSLAANARTTAGQNSQLTAMTGTPTSPSEAEFDLYTILKSQLVLMISALPPYVVAKLDGDQLGALNISTKIQREGVNYKGALEDYDVVSKARLPVPTPATGIRTTPQIGVSGRSGSYQQPIGAASQRPAYASSSSSSSARPAAPSATYPSHQYSSRPTPTAQYSSYSSQQPQTRPSYSAHQYGTQSTQAHSTQHTNGTRQHPTQNGYPSYSQQYASSQSAATPGAGQGSPFQRPSQPGYQQRAQNSQNYNYGTTSSARSTSPQNPAVAQTLQTPARASYGTPATAYPQSRPQYPQQPLPQVDAANATAFQANGTPLTIGQQLNMGAEEQAKLLARQKALIAEQDQLAWRQGSGTPQPANANSIQSNGTAMLQPNGIAAGSSS